MWRTVLATLLAILLTAGSAQGCFAVDLLKSYQTESAVYQLLSTATSAMSNSQYAEARDLLLKADGYGQTSYTPSIHKNLYRCYEGLKQYDKAIVEAKYVLSIEPSYDLAIYDMAQMYYAQGKFEQAIDTMNQFMAVSKDPYNRKSATAFIKNAGGFGYMQRARNAFNSNRFAEAKKWLQKAASYDPSDYTMAIHANMSFVLRKLGDPARAVEEGKRALSLDPNDRETTYNMAMAYEDLLDYDQALIWMNRYAGMETDASRRKQAQEFLAVIQDDRNQYQNPNNKTPDYMGVMRDSPDKIVRWSKDSFPLRVAIASGAGVKGYKPAFDNLVKVALDSWCQASGKRLDYKIVPDGGDADIRVVWTKDPLNATPDHPNLAVSGLTFLNNRGDGCASTGLVQIRTVDPFKPDEGVEDGECAHTVLHEVGHALGLGHSKLIKDVMYFRSAPQQGTLTSRDKATIARVYDGYPVIGFVPKQSPTAPATVPVAPPAFLPPAPPDITKVVPPMFVPPPLPASDKIMPPVYTPPPPKQVPAVNAPIFVPPASSGRTDKTPSKPSAGGAGAAPTARTKKTPTAPIFTPPPAR